jgi:hypothetical protein
MRYLALLSLLAAASLLSAENPASIAGVIRDLPTGPHVTGFRITAEDETGLGINDTSTAPGHYEIKNLKPGIYRLIANPVPRFRQL